MADDEVTVTSNNSGGSFTVYPDSPSVPFSWTAGSETKFRVEFATGHVQPTKSLASALHHWFAEHVRTHDQALAALTFLYDRVFDRPLTRLEGMAPARRSRHVPVVLSEAEVRAVLRHMQGSPPSSFLAQQSLPRRSCIIHRLSLSLLLPNEQLFPQN